MCLLLTILGKYNVIILAIKTFNQPRISFLSHLLNNNLLLTTILHYVKDCPQKKKKTDAYTVGIGRKMTCGKVW